MHGLLDEIRPRLALTVHSVESASPFPTLAGDRWRTDHPCDVSEWQVCGVCGMSE